MSFPNPQPVDLLTRRWRIRELVSDDLPDIASALADVSHRRYVLPMQHGVAYVDSIIAEALAAAPSRPRLIYRLVIECALSGKYVGYCTLHLDPRGRHTAYLGFEIAASASGRGVAAEAGRALADYAFAQIEVERIFADTDERNTPCLRTLEKIGFTRIRLWPWDRYAMRRKYRTRRAFVRMGLSRAQWRGLTESAAAGAGAPPAAATC